MGGKKSEEGKKRGRGKNNDGKIKRQMRRGKNMRWRRKGGIRKAEEENKCIKGGITVKRSTSGVGSRTAEEGVKEGSEVVGGG